MVDVWGFLYAASIAGGGVAGYLKAGSTASLAAGVAFGVLAGGGAYLTTKDPSNYWVSLGTSATVLAVMGSRFYSSGKFMPAGMVATLSLLMVLRYGSRLVQSVPQK